MNSQALIPLWIESKHDQLTNAQKVGLNIAAVLVGSILMAALAHVSFVLPFTPVPITLQTFGVALLALTWGSSRAVSAFAVYALEGISGLPVFAPVTGGATMGYLVGMFFACGVVGHLADRGFAKTIPRAFLCCLAGSFFTFSFGLIGLSFFLPANTLLKAGLLPFIPGDIIKSLLAATIAVSLRKFRRQ